MLNVNETIEGLPELSDDELELLELAIETDGSLTEDEKESLSEAIDEEWDERDEDDGEDDVFTDEIDADLDDEDDDPLEFE
jgi:hypothetical protein